jgi:hypothetical protein
LIRLICRSRIIRISKRLFSNAVELLSAHDLSSDQLSTLLAPQIRQLMRWHCRLSHVAAHTAMLTGDVHTRAKSYRALRLTPHLVHSVH